MGLVQPDQSDALEHLSRARSLFSETDTLSHFRTRQPRPAISKARRAPSIPDIHVLAAPVRKIVVGDRGDGDDGGALLALIRSGGVTHEFKGAISRIATSRYEQPVPSRLKTFR
jgi:hypothetical protein